MAGNKPGGVTDFRPPEHRQGVVNPRAETTAPYIDPAAMPAVARYVEGMAARAAQRRVELPKYDTPVGGGYGISMPRLDGAHVDGRTMASQAETVNSLPLHQQLATAAAAGSPGSIVEAPVFPGVPRANPGKAPSSVELVRQLGLRSTDMLPQEAQQDPAFQRGNGAMFAVSQPELAMRYGVVRDGQRLMPQQLQVAVGGRGQGTGLRPETMQGLKDLEELRQKQSPDQVREAEARAEKQVADSPAGQSVNVGSPIAAAKEDDPQAEARRRIEMMDSFDYDSLRQAINRDLLNNTDQRELIEKRVQPLDIDDLIIKNRVSQRVPIVPKRFEVTYTSMTGQDDLALKRLIMQESKSVEVTERYLLDKYAFMALTCGLTAVNGNSLPGHINDNGEFDEKLFWKKFEWVMQRPLHMLSSIGVNHTWFEMRVRKLFVAEKVGNT